MQITRTHPRLLVLLAALATAAGLLVPVSATSAAEPEPYVPLPTESPVALWAPERVVSRGPVLPLDNLGLRLVAPSDRPFVLQARRDEDYSGRFTWTWRSPDGDVALPPRGRSSISPIPRFLQVRIRNVTTGAERLVRVDGCLYGLERITPDGPRTSPFPSDCYVYGLFALGGVMGVPRASATPFRELREVRLEPGEYEVNTTIAPAYADVIGVTAEDRHVRTRLVVRPGRRGNHGHHQLERSAPAGPATGTPRRAGAHDAVRRAIGTPRGIEPRIAAAGEPTDGVPDLRPLPAFEVSLYRNLLSFGATVWNAGTAPMVVEGFRRRGEQTMDTYQYFFDAEGNETGHQQVGTMHWHAAPTHRHWHFLDFARYSLLKADKTEVVRSRKQSFCLVNTDAVDLTLPNAVMAGWGQDLSSSCGGRTSLSERQVLDVGWGDTYFQFRAGQALRIKGLPNGVYYIATIANPTGRLVEASTDNNIAYRKIRLGGRPGHRTLKVFPVGIITD